MAKIEHVLVLMLENRSFDHMLGFLNHPDSNFEGLDGTESNIWDPAQPPAIVSSNAGYDLDPGPGHSYQDAMTQLTGKPLPDAPYVIDNSGFAKNYEQIGLAKKGVVGLGPEVMRCQSPNRVPVLATLAKEFAVCDHWFSSVPGETWPNRHFAHAGTSNGEVNINIGLYFNRTIFEQLSAENRDWLIFHDGNICLSMAFPNLWGVIWRQRFRALDNLYWRIRHDKLPDYAFIEPDYLWPDANSQHPFNNRSNGNEFKAGERLIQDIYEALVANPTVWNKTLLLITYDEHGGFYDHVAPPQGANYRDGRVSAEGFRFDLLGPRVPAVLVSPYIPRGTLDSTIYDHSSIVATVRSLFAPSQPELTNRDRNANTFHHNASLDNPRSLDDIPRFSLLVDTDASGVVPASAPNPLPQEIDDFQQSLYELMNYVALELDSEGEEIDIEIEAGLATTELLTAGPISEGIMVGAEVYHAQVAHQFRESGERLVVLRTALGETFEKPPTAVILNALDELYSLESEEANVSLLDMTQQALTAYANGRLVYIENDNTAVLDGLDMNEQLALMAQFRNGQIEMIRSAFEMS